MDSTSSCAACECQRKKAEHFALNEEKAQSEWMWWSELLTAAARLVRARADAGDEHARLTIGGSSAGEFDRGPAALVERLHKHEARISELRAKLKELGEHAVETRAHMRKVRFPFWNGPECHSYLHVLKQLDSTP